MSELTYNHTLPEQSVTYIHSLSSEFPQAKITYFLRPSHCSRNCRGYIAKWAEERDRSHPIDLFIRIGFSKEITQSFVDDFFETLKSTHNLFRNIHHHRHGKFREEFCIRIGPHYSQDEIQVFIEQANIVMYKKWLHTITGGINE